MRKPLKETKEDRFRRVAEARVNKILRMIRLLGNCSGTAVYKYSLPQVDQIFDTLQAELSTARARFEIPGSRFRLTQPYNLQREMKLNPHVSLKMPNGNIITAVVYAEDAYPAINLYCQAGDSEPELICFVEYNAAHGPDQALHIGVYREDDEDTQYYAPYKAERNLNGTTD